MTAATVAPATKRDIVPLPKGSLAIALIQKSYCTMHTGTQHYQRLFIVRVESADRRGSVKTFSRCPGDTAQRMSRAVTIFSFPPQYLESAQHIFDRAAIDSTGFTDKEHLRLALVNDAARNMQVA